MTVAYAASSSHSQTVRIGVYAFSNVTLRASDRVLNRYLTLAGSPATSCGQARAYQRTEVVALVDGFDVTPLVTFVSSGPSVAAASSAPSCSASGQPTVTRRGEGRHSLLFCAASSIAREIELTSASGCAWSSTRRRRESNSASSAPKERLTTGTHCG